MYVLWHSDSHSYSHDILRVPLCWYSMCLAATSAKITNIEDFVKASLVEPVANLWRFGWSHDSNVCLDCLKLHRQDHGKSQKYDVCKVLYSCAMRLNILCLFYFMKKVSDRIRTVCVDATARRLAKTTMAQNMPSTAMCQGLPFDEGLGILQFLHAVGTSNCLRMSFGLTLQEIQADSQ